MSNQYIQANQVGHNQNGHNQNMQNANMQHPQQNVTYSNPEMISHYQNELTKCNNLIAENTPKLTIAENDLKNLNENAVATFGTSDPNELNSKLTELTADIGKLEEELKQVDIY